MNLPERPREGRLISGVCAGLGEAYTLDPTLIRLAFLLLALAYGLGLILYGLLWLLLPEVGQRHAQSLREVARQNVGTFQEELQLSGQRLSTAWRRFGRQPWPRPFNRRWIALALMVAGAMALLASCGVYHWLTPLRAFGLAVIAVGGAVLLTLRNPR